MGAGKWRAICSNEMLCESQVTSHKLQGASRKKKLPWHLLEVLDFVAA